MVHVVGYGAVYVPKGGVLLLVLTATTSGIMLCGLKGPGSAFGTWTLYTLCLNEAQRASATVGCGARLQEGLVNYSRIV